MVAEVLAYTEGSMKFYKGLLELMTAASTRTSVALCYRVDMDKVVEEGKQRYLADQAG